MIRSFFLFRFRRSAENTSSTTDSNILSNVWNETLTSMEPEKCGLKPLVIDFSDLGFSSWIIEPKSYVSNLCSGICTTKVCTQNDLIINRCMNMIDLFLLF